MKIDQDILDGLKSGDKSALLSVFDRFGSVVYGVVFRIVKSEEAAQKLTADTFQKIWQQAPSTVFTPQQFFADLMRTARSVALDANQNRDIPEGYDFLAYQQHRNASGGTATLPLSKIAKDLGEKNQRAIDLALFEGMDQEEIEQAMNMPVGTVNTRLRNAMRAMRALFN